TDTLPSFERGKLRGPWIGTSRRAADAGGTGGAGASPVTRIVRVLAPNPGPYTLEGTNTWVVGDAPAIVIDPGPADEDHVAEVARPARRVQAILLTHHD